MRGNPGLVPRIHQRGIVTTYSYDGNYNMLSKIVDGNGVTADANEIFTYDGLGRMLSARKSVAGTQIALTEFTYNDIGRVTDTNETLFDLGTKTIRYSYDQAGFRTSTTYPYNSIVINVTPDWQGRIDTLKIGSTSRVEYEYIGSRVARRKYMPSIFPTLNNVIYSANYDNLGRITTAGTKKDTATIARFDYQYDPNANTITKMTYAHRDNDPCVDFSYDDLDRLTFAGYGIDDTNEVFTTDKLGNRETVNVRDGNDVTYVIQGNML